MNLPPETDFDPLKKLLALKRHEQPPPGYFNRFGDRLALRLEQEELRAHSSWWESFIQGFDARPILACAYGMAVSGLLITGFALADMFQNQSGTVPRVSGPGFAVAPPHASSLSGQVLHSLTAQDENEGSALSPSFPSRASFSPTQPLFRPVSFQTDAPF